MNDRFFSATAVYSLYPVGVCTNALGLYSQGLNANQVEITVQQGKDGMFYLTVY